MSKPAYEVWIRDMDGQMSHATPEGKPGIFDSVQEAEKWALDLSDNDQVMYAYVVQRRVSRTFEGKGLIARRATGGGPPEFEGFSS